VKLFLLLLSGLRALEAHPADAESVAESFLLKLLSVSGFHPSLTACAVCGAREPGWFSSGQGGALCDADAEQGAEPVSAAALAFLADLAAADLPAAGDITPDEVTRKEGRALLFPFAEYHLERRMRSLPLLARSLSP